MNRRRVALPSAAFAVLGSLGLLGLLGACASETTAPPSTSTSAPVTSPPLTTDASTTEAASTAASTTQPATTESVATSTVPPAALAPVTASPTTTTTVVLPGTPGCVVQIQPGDSLSAIADRVGNEAVTVQSLQVENAIADADSISAGAYLDTCVGNGVDDITGAVRPPPPPPAPVVAPSTGSGVVAQQEKLNALFGGLGLPPLAVDGQAGRLTRQALCAARVALGMPASRDEMAAGGAEEQALMAAASLAIPAGAPTWASRWVLVDQTCQVTFVGEGSGRLVFVFPSSTGEAGHETRGQDGSTVFRYDPATDNGGWHNSTHYPVPADNPLNGNMYKPLYFDDGQAIHGANNVPPEPRSKGCVRLRVEHQELLVGWLGLGDVTQPLWDPDDIGLAVSVQGAY